MATSVAPSDQRVDVKLVTMLQCLPLPGVLLQSCVWTLLSCASPAGLLAFLLAPAYPLILGSFVCWGFGYLRLGQRRRYLAAMTAAPVTVGAFYAAWSNWGGLLAYPLPLLWLLMNLVPVCALLATAVDAWQLGQARNARCAA
jgi:hypothetical protein